MGTLGGEQPYSCCVEVIAAPRHPIFARVYDVLASLDERRVAPYRARICGDLRGTVLEVGAGSGLNFRHYRGAELVVAAEPEPTMLRNAARRVRSARVPIDLVRASAERLPIADRSVDAVVCSLVLCSVRDLDAAVAECSRVLRVGGKLRFFEHVRAERDAAARWQDRLERPWGWFAGGCHPNRDTVAALERRGFDVRFERAEAPAPVATFLPEIVGEAWLRT